MSGRVISKNWHRGPAGLKVAEALEQLEHLQQREAQLIEQLRISLHGALQTPEDSELTPEADFAWSCQQVGAELASIDHCKTSAITVLKHADQCEPIELILSTQSFLSVVQQPPPLAVANRYLLPAPTVTVVLPPRFSMDADRTFVVRAQLSYSNSDAPLQLTLDGKQDVLQGVTLVPIDKHRRAIFQKLKIMEVSSKHQHRYFSLVFRLIECHHGNQIQHATEVRSAGFQVQSRPHKRKRGADSPPFPSIFPLSSSHAVRKTFSLDSSIPQYPRSLLESYAQYPNVDSSSPAHSLAPLASHHGLHSPHPLHQHQLHPYGSSHPSTSRSSSSSAQQLSDDSLSSDKDSDDSSDSDSPQEQSPTPHSAIMVPQPTSALVALVASQQHQQLQQQQQQQQLQQQQQQLQQFQSQQSSQMMPSQQLFTSIDVSLLLTLDLSIAAERLRIPSHVLAHRYKESTHHQWPAKKLRKIENFLSRDHTDQQKVARILAKKKQILQNGIVRFHPNDFLALQQQPQPQQFSSSFPSAQQPTTYPPGYHQVRGNNGVALAPGQSTAPGFTNPSWLPSFVRSGGHSILLPSLPNPNSNPNGVSSAPSTSSASSSSTPSPSVQPPNPSAAPSSTAYLPSSNLPVQRPDDSFESAKQIPSQSPVPSVKSD